MIRGRGDGHDGVGLDQRERTAQPPGHGFAPLPLDPEIADIPDDAGGIAGHVWNGVFGRAGPEAEAHAAGGQARLRFPEAFEHELVMAPVGLGEDRQGEANNHGQVQGPGQTDGMLQRLVPFRPLGLLHPIQDKIAPAGRSRAQVMDAGRSVHRTGAGTWRRADSGGAHTRNESQKGDLMVGGGGGNRGRTGDLRLMSPPLCQLSYPAGNNGWRQ